MRTRQGDPDDQALPKLTLTQRLLAALPNLQRDPTASSGKAPSAGPSKAGSQVETEAPGDTDDDVVRPDAVIGPNGSNGSTTGSRLRDAFTKPATGNAKSPSSVYADMSVPELRESMKYLNPQERRIALAAGPLLAVLDLIATAVTIHDNPALGHKGHFDPGTQLVIGVASAVIALMVLVAAYYRRRSFTLFALLFCGYGGGLTTMIPAWFLAGWLFIHFNRMQKVVVRKTGGPAGARQAAAKARAERSPARRGSRQKTPEPVGPSPNKRYTPPKPGAGR